MYAIRSYYDYWDGSVTVTADDFKSLDESLLTITRNDDYTLPETDFLQLVEGSDLIDAGTPFGGFSYNSTAPDLGAFESTYTGITTGFDDIQQDSDLKIFPNPATNSIQTQADVERMEIFDMSGKLISSSNYNWMDISNFKRGMYLVRLILEDGRITSYNVCYTKLLRKRTRPTISFPWHMSTAPRKRSFK